MRQATSELGHWVPRRCVGNPKAESHRSRSSVVFRGGLGCPLLAGGRGHRACFAALNVSGYRDHLQEGEPVEFRYLTPGWVVAIIGRLT